MSAFLLDVNLLLAFLHPRHADHDKARRWVERHDDPRSLLICRVAHMGALRLLTSPVVMGVDLLTPSEAWGGYQEMVGDGRFATAEEPPSLDAAWHGITVGAKGVAKVDTDTYLAAFALAGGHALATFDKGFARFDGLQTEIL